jgi:hypothetical protein
MDGFYKPDCIIGLLRGGVVPARIFADYYNIVLDFFALDVKLYNGIDERREKPLISTSTTWPIWHCVHYAWLIETSPTRARCQRAGWKTLQIIVNLF